MRGPEPDETDSWPGTGERTKSRSGVRVYWQRIDRTGSPDSGSSVRMKDAIRSSISGSGSDVRDSGSEVSMTGPPQSWAAFTVGSP